MDIIYRYELMVIQYSAQHDLLLVEWSGFVTSEEYRRVMREMVKFTNELKIRNWIFNMSQSEKLEIGDFDWTTQYLGPIIMETTLQKIARVDEQKRPGSEKLKALIEEVKTKLELTIEVELFDDIDQALNWIMRERTISVV